LFFKLISSSFPLKITYHPSPNWEAPSLVVVEASLDVLVYPLKVKIWVAVTLEGSLD
jgi:hypothetical protein